MESEAARRIEAELKRAGTPERAVAEKRYLKSELTFYGVALAEMRRLARDVSKTARLDHDRVVALAEELWKKPVFERRMSAVILLELHARDLTPGDLPLIERLIRESKTWALVDALAGDVVSTIGQRTERPASPCERW